MNEILVILSIFILIKKCIGDSDQDECKLCNNPMEHLFCLYPNPESPPPPECQHMDVSITNDGFRQRVLDFHNGYRNNFSDGTYGNVAKLGFPQAANMRLLRYDSQLEKLAMLNARNCLDHHDLCRTVSKYIINYVTGRLYPLIERFHYGQNLGSQRWRLFEDLPKETNYSWFAWMDEMQHYDVNDVDYYSRGNHRGQVGHFIAATWWKVRLLGCAQVVYKKEVEGPVQKWRIEVVCNYGPLGQTDREAMYKRGKPCSQCPEGTKCPVNEYYPNLCVKVDDTMETEDDPYIMKGILRGGIPRIVTDIYTCLTPIILCYVQSLLF